MRNYFTFAGKDCREFNLYVNGHRTFDSPEKDYSMIQVPGRNGDVAMDGNRLSNIELHYDSSFIFEDFDESFSNLKNFLLSQRGYQRLVDTYHPNEYRLAIFRKAIEPTMNESNEVGAFDLVFECQPQRYLLSGEVIDEMDVSNPPGETITDNIVEIDNPDNNLAIFDLKADIRHAKASDGTISGYSSANIVVSPTQDASDGNTYEVQFNKTVYDGKIDIDSGILTDESDFIYSYNPSSIPSNFAEIIEENSEITDATPGDIVSFDCELGEYPIKKLAVAINHVQDLHGYDAPWPAGGGKNKLTCNTSEVYDRTISGITFTVTRNADNDLLSIAAKGTSMARVTMILNYHIENQLPSGDYILSGCPSGGGNRKYRLTCWDNTASVTLANDYGSGKTFTLDATHAINCAIDISNGQTVDLVFEPMIRLASESDPTFAPYSNECPISGWTGVEATRTGKNMLPNERAPGETEVSGVTIVTNADGSIECNGTATDDASVTIVPMSYGLAKKLNPGNYVLRGCPSGGSGSTYRLVGNFNKGAAYSIDTGSGASITITNEINSFSVYIRFNAGAVFNHLIFYPTLMLGSEADLTYEPYYGAVHEIDFPDNPGTVYGGEMELVSGELKARPYYESYNGEPLTGPWISSMDVYAPGTTPTIGAQVVDLGGVETVYQLTPTQIATLTGVNNVWADTGEITELKYYDGDVNDFEDVDTSKGALVSGSQILYPKDTPVVTNLTPLTFPLLEGKNYVFTNTGDTTLRYAEPFSIENPTLFDSEPLIRVYGTGRVGIGEYTIAIDEDDGYTDIDCHMMDCYKGNQNRNSYVTLSNHEFPVLKPGKNIVTMGTGISKVEITPRWWKV